MSNIRTQIQVENYVFSSGIDTKTNPIFVKEKLLLSNNAEQFNVSSQKTTGYVELGSTSITSSTINQHIFTYGSDLYRIQNNYLQTYRLDLDVFQDKSVFRVLDVSSFIGYSNIQGISTFPIISALYGIYIAYIIYSPTTGYFVLYVANTTSEKVLYQNDTFLADTGRVLDIVGTPNGFYIYTTSLYTIDPTAIDETVISTYDFSSYTNSAIESDLHYFTASDYPDYAQQYYPSLSGKYANGLLFILYRTGSDESCVGKMIVRNLSNLTVFYTTNYASAMDLTGNQGNLNIGAFALEDSNTHYVLFMFGYNFYLLNTGSFVNELEFSYTTPEDEIFQTFNVGILIDSTEFVMLKHNPVQSTTVDVQICPFINKYNYTTQTWSLYTNTCNTTFTNNYYYTVPGACCLAGGVVGLNSVAYFVVAAFSYCSLVVDSALVSETPVDQRRCSLFLVDSDYNVVQSLQSFDATLYTVYGETDTDPTYSYIPSVARIKINALANTDSNIIYPLLFNQSVYDNGEVITVTECVRLVNVSSVLPTQFFSVEYNRSSYFAVSQLTELSNSTVSEQNFFDFPQIILSEDDTVGSLTALGNYKYAAIYTWVNGQGELVRSAQSISQLITLSEDITSVRIDFTPLPFYSVKSNPIVKIYRSQNNGNVLTLVYSGAFIDLWDSGNFYFIDSQADTNILDEELIYTSSGVLSDFPFFPSNAFVSHVNRIFSIRQQDTLTIDYSKPTLNNIALASSPFFAFTVDPLGGDCVALASLDEKLIIFKQDYIFGVVGNPPDAFGQNSTLSTPTLINSPVGCISPNSVVRTPLGIIFKSYKGIYLLDRSLTVSYIGADVEDYNSETTLCAELLLRQNKIKISNLSGNNLIFDYYYNTWNVETGLIFVSSCVYNGDYTAQLYSGETYSSDTTIYKRNGVHYNQYIETPWFKCSGIQGQMQIEKIIILGRILGPHILNVQIFFDYVDAPMEFFTFNPTENTGLVNSFGIGNWGQLTVFGGTLNSNFEFNIQPNNLRCMSFKLSFSDAFQNLASETGESFDLSALTIAYVPVDNTNPLFVSQSITNGSSPTY